MTLVNGIEAFDIAQHNDRRKLWDWPGILSLTGHLKIRVSQLREVAIFQAIPFPVLIHNDKRLPLVRSLELLFVIPKIAVLAERVLKGVALPITRWRVEKNVAFFPFLTVAPATNMRDRPVSRQGISFPKLKFPRQDLVLKNLPSLCEQR